MNTTKMNHNHGTGSTIAFVFGAAFNLLAGVDLSFLVDYTLQALVGGFICLGFKVTGDILSPLWEKHKEKVKDFAKVRKLRNIRIRRRKRNDKEK